MKIEKRKISDLKYDDRNARSHDEKNIKAITGSLKKLGQQKPIVVNKDNVVIAGNGTLMAAASLGWEDIDVVVTTLSKRDQTAYALADNRTTDLSTWNLDNLGSELSALIGEGFDVDDIGFSEEDLLAFFKRQEDALDDMESLEQKVFKLEITFDDEKSMLDYHKTCVEAGVAVRIKNG